MASDASPDAAQQMVAEWVEKTGSAVYIAPSGKIYLFFTEPDGEGPTMLYVGSTWGRALYFVRERATNKFRS